MENVTAVKEALEKDRLCFGTLDSWIMWVGVYRLTLPFDVNEAVNLKIFKG